MLNSTTNTYILKREILNFSNKISRTLSKLERKFTADMTYGMLAGGSCLLTELDKELTRIGHRFVRYADNCMIFCKSRKSAKKP